MNEKSYLNKAVFVFAVQSCFYKILKFLTQAIGSVMVWQTQVHGFGRPAHGFSNNARPKHGCQIQVAWGWHGCQTQSM
jgi:hypothetical protein